MVILKFVWLIYIIQLLSYSLISPLISDHEVGLLILIIMHSIFVFLYLLKFNKKIRFIFWGGFVGRIAVMMIDIYLRNYVSIPHSGADTERFLRRASLISDSFQTIIESQYEFFIKVVAVLFRITSNERIIFQYTNVLLGFTIVYLMYLILNTLNINKKSILITTTITAFFPHSLFFSGILLREIPTTFFVIASLYFLVKWYDKNRDINFYLSVLMILISALFHSGVIGLLLGHIFIYLFYQPSTKQLNFTFRTVGFFVIISIFLMWFFGVYDWNSLAIFRKLNIDSFQDVLETSASRRGGSAYLIGLSINNFWQFLIYTPIFILYFISSPLPFNWRGINDIFSFMLDGIFYLGMSIYILFNLRKVRINHKSLAIILLVSLLGALVIFGVGVQNAGTALRHRHKLFHVFLLIFTLMRDKKIENLDSDENSITIL